MPAVVSGKYCYISFFFTLDVTQATTMIFLFVYDLNTKLLSELVIAASAFVRLKAIGIIVTF